MTGPLVPYAKAAVGFLARCTARVVFVFPPVRWAVLWWIGFPEEGPQDRDYDGHIQASVDHARTAERWQARADALFLLDPRCWWARHQARRHRSLKCWAMLFANHNQEEEPDGTSTPTATA